ncbi:hypothetical protein ABZ135_23165 [Streptomyces sp. NPDC006339]|uniref:hypothetical protein n=1 Tax=Streptomyces sp. NPDC006339 TaxID=3156755 RepID=UPI0033B33420
MQADHIETACAGDIVGATSELHRLLLNVAAHINAMVQSSAHPWHTTAPPHRTAGRRRCAPRVAAPHRAHATAGRAPLSHTPLTAT